MIELVLFGLGVLLLVAIPLVMVVAVAGMVVRGLFWRGAWGGRGCGYRGVPPAFDEWHRRAHAQQVRGGAGPTLT